MLDDKIVDIAFPIKSSGAASYRQYQKETIMDAGQILFIDNKKFVAVNAPVGSGKSAINVALEKIAGLSSVYITPLTILQDQIVNEEWPGMICVKGRSNYLCQVFGDDNTRFTCDYDGSAMETCNSSEKNYYPAPSDMDVIADKVDLINKKFGGLKNLLRMKTSFSSSDEFRLFMKRAQDKFNLIYEQALNSGVSTIKKMNALELVCCDKCAAECPVKSSRLRSRFADITVMNPDVFFHLSRTPESGFNSVPMMVIDECQQIESVIGRLFRIKIPVDTLSEILEIDFGDMVRSETDEDLFKSFEKIVYNILGPIAAIAKTLSKIEPLLAVKNARSLAAMEASNELLRSFKSSNMKFFVDHQSQDKKWFYPMAGLFDSIFGGKEMNAEMFGECGSFFTVTKQYFLDKCNSLQCSNVCSDFLHLVSRIMIVENEDDIKKEIEPEFSTDDHSTFIGYARSIIKLGESLHKIVESIESLNSLKSELTGKPVYIVSKQSGRKINACEDMPFLMEYYDKKRYYETERYIDIVPVDTGRVMNCFFYSKAEKVLLSSGTWVMPQKLFKTYGLPSDCDLINVPSTFPPERRPVFIIQNKDITDFSKKTGKEYIYKTQEGSKKYLNELSYLIKLLRNHIQNKHGEKANIIVHCHTFDISHHIAEFLPDLDDKYIVQVKSRASAIKNVHTGKVTEPIRKNELIDFISRHPNEGITLISPSVGEGVDFKYDIARGQIILKRPTPSIGDPYIKVKMKGNEFAGIPPDHSYFDSVVMSSLVQQYGRVVRAKDDYGYTIVVDQSIATMLEPLLRPLNKFKRDLMNVEYFLEGIQYKLDSNGFPNFLWF